MTSILISVLLVLGAVACGGLDVRLECVAEAYRGPGLQGWKGYTLDELSLPSLGTLHFTLAFPGSWQLEACCQKLQLKFDHEDLESLLEDQGYLLPKAEWTLCSQDMRLYTCYGFLAGDIKIHRSQIPRGSWWLNVQHCFQPFKDAISYELWTFGEAISSAARTPRYSGTSKVMDVALQSNQRKPAPSYPCLVDGHVNTDDQWFGYLAKMDIPKDSSISYRFVFSMEEPSNEAPLTVLFYTQSDLDSVKNQNTCEGRTSILTTPQNSYKLLPLSISNVWSGCLVDNFNGTATYICEGGRTLAEKQTLNVAVSNCKLTKGLKFNYFLEFLNFQSCPSEPETLGQRLVSTGATLHCMLTLVKLLTLITVIGFS